MSARRGGLVEMERLRIESCGKGFDLLGGKGVAAEALAVADANVVEKFHART